MKKLLVTLAVFVTASAHAQEPTASGFQWGCAGTGRDSMQCKIRNNSQAAGELCVDVVKVCKDGDHRATMCSGLMQSGEVTSRVVHEFFPKVKLFASCMGVEYRDAKVRPDSRQ